MTCCIDLIKEDISTIKERSISDRKAIENDIDTFLDAILGIQENIKGINADIVRLDISLRNYFGNITIEYYNEIYPLLKKAISVLLKLYNTYRKSVLYAGIKSDVSIFKSSIDNLNEDLNDLKVFRFELPQDKEYERLVSLINSL